MSKWKINPNFFALIMVASLFAEWKFTIIIGFLIFLLWGENEKLRKLAIQVVAISSACSLFYLLWNAISSGFSVVNVTADTIKTFITMLDEMYTRPEWVYKLLEILKSVEKLLASLVSFIVYFAKFSFIIAIIKGDKPKKGIFKKIGDYLDMFTNFVDKNIYSSNQSTTPQPQTAQQQTQINDPINQ